MSQSLPKTDVVIVGMGAAGGMASHSLTMAGLNVVGLEAGPRWTLEDFFADFDELESWSMRNSMGRPKVNHEIPTWRPNEGAEVQPPPIPASLMANGVGGSSIHYSAAQWRFRADDFKMRSTTIEKYGEDALPAGSAIADWPISYDDLEPYYDQVDQLLGVAGVGGANPFESTRSSDFPLPPLRQTGYTNLVADAMSKLGYNPFPQPAAILSEPYKGRDACTYCGLCTGYGCWNNSKSSTLVTVIPEAEETGNLEIRTNCRVTRLIHDDAGKATGVEYLDAEGNTFEQPAGIVIVSSYTYENNRLLFLSDLGNSNGQLGKYYITHSYATSNGYFPDTNLNRMSGVYTQSMAMDDLNGDNFEHEGLGFIRGGMINGGMGESNPIGASRGTPPSVKPWGPEYKAWLKNGMQGMGSVGAQLDVLPYEFNFLDLDPEKKDLIGMPVIRVTYSLDENEVKMAEYLNPKMEEILQKMGATETWSYPAANIPINTHAFGGTRMGEDPESSVVNKYGQIHDMDNLIVLGASNFPNSTGYNPTHTLQAHALYSSEFIAANFSDLTS